MVGSSLGLEGLDLPDSGLALPRTYGLVVDGQSRPSAAGRTFERRSPADGRLIGIYADADVSDVEAAIVSARAEFDHGAWPRLRTLERAAIFGRAGELARRRAEELAELVCWEVGKPIEQARGEIRQLVEALDYVAGAVSHLHGEAVTSEDPGGLGLILHEPVGVVAAITSYNFPSNLVAAKVPYALAAGCTVVLKPSELSSGIAFEIANLLFDAGLPSNALHVISCSTPTAAEYLVESPLVDKVAFTGSTRTGQAIMRAAAGTLKRLTLELGGKGPIVVFPDADPDEVIGAIHSSIFLMAGQVCTAGSRLVVHEEIHDQILEGAVRVAESETVGHPFLPETTMGPIATPAGLERIERAVAVGVDEGGVVVTGGNRLSGGLYDVGSYFAPTILDRVDPVSRLGQEEVFGPVLAVMSFRDDEEAVQIANCTPYGLKASVWTRDPSRLLRTIRSIRSGIVMGNTAGATVPQVGMPFGGYKMSGFGREYGMSGLIESFMETKSVFLKV